MRPVRLGNVCDVVMGQAPKGDSYNTEGLGWPLIAGAGDFHAGCVRPSKFTTAPTKLSEAGDMLVGIRASIGERAIPNQRVCLGRGVAALRAGPELDRRFLWHWMAEVAPKLASKGRGATFKQVSRRDIDDLEIPLPSVDEQRRIARLLDAADALMSARERWLSCLARLRDSAFHDLFGPKCPEADGWGVEPISHGCSLIVDCVNRTAPTVDHQTPFKMIRTTNVRAGKVDLANVRYVDATTFARWNRRATPVVGDVLLTREAPVGQAGILTSDDCVILGQRLMLYRVDPRRLTAEYLLESFRSPFLRSQFNRHGAGSTVKHLPLPACRNFMIVIPPIERQRDFSARVQAMNRLEETGALELARMKALFAALQHRAFAGRL